MKLKEIRQFTIIELWGSIYSEMHTKSYSILQTTYALFITQVQRS